MKKIRFHFLDIPIIRSCNLGCVGCMTFSDHKNIKGLVNLEESLDWLKFWASKLHPTIINIFGGEPLLHPHFIEWATEVKKIWGSGSDVGVNTNGYYLHLLFDKVHELFQPGNIQNIIVSIQTNTEPYLSKVEENIRILKQKIIDYYLSMPNVKTAEWYLWLDESETAHKQWFTLVVNGEGTNIGFTVCEMYKLFWASHYNGSGPTVVPNYDYNDQWYKENHGHCQAKEYMTLYRGTLYKCPPVGVLEHTLDTFNLKETTEWKPYIDNYKSLPAFSTDNKIIDWMNRQKEPELVCNMCAFSGPNRKTIDRSHFLKPNWKYTL
jgi:MoaA/NifB/PqqE/SkfB family radical SAM enzyme